MRRRPITGERVGQNRPIIAIDGPVASGKSMVARMVAERLGFAHLDTGAMYRAVGVLAETAGLAPGDEAGIGELASGLDFRFRMGPDGAQRLFVNGRDLTAAIRTRQADEWAARVAGITEVRRALVAAQRKAVVSGPVCSSERGETGDAPTCQLETRNSKPETACRGWVVEGRDMQTVVFPEADLKVFLTASLEERAKRRLTDIENRGEQATLEQVVEDIAERDRLDETRAFAPLKKAPEAVEVPTDGLSAEEVAERIVSLACAKIGSGQWPVPRQARDGEQSRTMVSDQQQGNTHPSSLIPRPSSLTPNPSARHPLFYLGRALCRAFFKVMGRWRIYGRENVPASGGVILAPNHVSYVDPPLAGSAIGRKTWFMAKSELFEIPVLGPILPGVCAYPVKRGRPDREALRITLDLLAQGQVVTIFPEGTRSPDGTLQKPELGIGLVALRSGAPVLPMALIGSDRLLPRGSPIPRFAKVTVRIGPALRFVREEAPSRQHREKVAQEIMSALASLIALGHR